jgi:ABC-type multidrug transport system ATPase subunit
LYELEHRRLTEHADRLLALFSLEKQADATINSYSTGQRKKIALAAALITEAPIMLLDEPFAGGLDPAGILALRHVLRRLVSSPARTVVMTAPVPELVEELADEVVVLSAGQVMAHDNLAGLRTLTRCDGPLAEVLTRITHPQTMDTIERYCQETPA